MIDTEMSAERFAQLHPRIQAKITAAREAAARREQKKEDREALRDWLRLQELQAIPVKQRSKDEHNEFQRLYRKQRRLEERGEATVAEKVEERIRTKEQFWALNRASQSSQKIAEWTARQEDVLATLDWMDRIDNGTETPEHCGENYVSLEEGAQDILDDIEEHDVARLGSVHENEDIPGDWPDGIFTGLAFFKDAVFRMLCAENEPTRVYVTTGILIALPDWRVWGFLARHCGWTVRQAQEHVGLKFSDSTVTVKY